MSGETNLTVVGNLTADPELRYTPSGVAAVSFTVASTARVLDRASGQWKDGDTLFMRCTAWRDCAEHAAQSLGKGDRVIVTGRLRQRSWETDAGERHTAVELVADEVGTSLRYVVAFPVKTTRNVVEETAS